MSSSGKAHGKADRRFAKGRFAARGVAGAVEVASRAKVYADRRSQRTRQRAKAAAEHALTTQHLGFTAAMLEPASARTAVEMAWSASRVLINDSESRPLRSVRVRRGTDLAGILASLPAK